MTKVISYQSPRGDIIHVTPAQARALTTAQTWPRDSRGEEYCKVSRGLHSGTPTYDSADIDAIVQAVQS